MAKFEKNFTNRNFYFEQREYVKMALFANDYVLRGPEISVIVIRLTSTYLLDVVYVG
jgi:hypothetical protein